jgi:hypothetical protein
VLDRQPLGEEDKKLLESLLDTQFRVRYDRDDLVVAQRMTAGQPSEP